MRENGSSPARQQGWVVRRIVPRFAEVVCPPEVCAGNLRDKLLAEFESLLQVLPSGVRWSVRSGLVAFDQGARLYPRARGRRFVQLADADAEAYFRAVLARRGGLGAALQRIKGLVVFCYYELPEVKDQIGYQPDAYIAAVSQRRLASYGPQIRAGEAAVLAPGAGPDAGGAAGCGERPAMSAVIPAGLTRQSEVSADLRVECGVVIVGSGAGGATMAAELADAGVDVVVVEEGGYHPTESFTAETGRALRTLYRDGGIGLALGKPPVLFSEGRCVGGSTVVNGGMSWRTPGRVLRRWAEEEGIAAISEQDM